MRCSTSRAPLDLPISSAPGTFLQARSKLLRTLSRRWLLKLAFSTKSLGSSIQLWLDRIWRSFELPGFAETPQTLAVLPCRNTVSYGCKATGLFDCKSMAKVEFTQGPCQEMRDVGAIM